MWWGICVGGGKKLNKLEKLFFDSWNEYSIEQEDEDYVFTEENPIGDKGLIHGVVIGPYKVDFTYGDCVIELDGHDYHKTKEQRDSDYKRERYLQKLGYTVIRFTGTEVFLEPRKCIIDMITINNLFEQKLIDAYCKGMN